MNAPTDHLMALEPSEHHSAFDRCCGQPDLWRCARIGNRQINLAPLQRYLVSGVIDANNQFSCRSSQDVSTSKEARDLEFSLPNSSGLIPVYLGPDNLAAS
jgi:hypothetical protein